MCNSQIFQNDIEGKTGYYTEYTFYTFFDSIYLIFTANLYHLKKRVQIWVKTGPDTPSRKLDVRQNRNKNAR